MTWERNKNKQKNNKGIKRNINNEEYTWRKAENRWTKEEIKNDGKEEKVAKTTYEIENSKNYAIKKKKNRKVLNTYKKQSIINRRKDENEINQWHFIELIKCV